MKKAKKGTSRFPSKKGRQGQKKPAIMGVVNKKKGNKKGKKKKKEKKAEQPNNEIVPPPIPARIPVLRARKKHWGSWLGSDFIVIFVLWTLEVVHVFYDACKDVTLSGHYETHNRDTKIPNLPLGLVFALVALLLMFFVSVYSREWTFKYWIVLLAMYVYSIGAVLGIFFMTHGKRILIILATWIQLSWYAVSPIRYFLIFNQRWPIRILYTRIIVSVNLFLIGISRYVSVVFIRQETHVTDTALLSGWVHLVIIMFVWLFGVHLLQYFVLEEPIYMAEIDEIYKFTSAYSWFTHRHEWNMLFIMLLVPCVIFNLTTVAVTAVISQYKTSIFYSQRFDLIVAAVAMGLTKLVFTFANIVREELEDLLTIFITHILNMLALILLLGLILNAKSDQIKSRADQDIKGEAYLIFSNIWSSNDMKFYINDGPPQNVRLGHMSFTIPLLEDEAVDIKCRATIKIEEEEETVFDQHIQILPEKTRVYYSPGKMEPFILLPPPEVKTDDDKAQYLLLYNLVDNCNPPPHGIVSPSGKCDEVTLYFEEYEEIDKPLKNLDLNLPKKYEPPVVVKCDSKYMKLKLNSKEQPSSETVIPTKPGTFMLMGLSTDWTPNEYNVIGVTVINRFPITDEVPEEDEPTVEPTSLIDIIDDYLHIHPVTVVAIMMAGFARGAASVSYIHFVWLFCPFEDRTMYLAFYLVWIFIFGGDTDAWMVPYSLALVLILLCVQAFLIAGHFMCMVVFAGTLPELTEEEQKGKRQF